MARPVKRTAKHIPQGVDVVTRTLMLDHMNQGRWFMMHDQDMLKRLPYFLYDAIIDAVTTDICLGYNGTLLPANHSFWTMHWPPNHWGCRSIVRSVSRRTAGRRGVTEKIPKRQPGQGWGASPVAKPAVVDLLGAQGKDQRLVQVAREKVRSPAVAKPRDVTKEQAQAGFDDTKGLLGKGVRRIRVVGTGSERTRSAVYEALKGAGLPAFFEKPGRTLDSFTLTDRGVHTTKFDAMSDHIEGGPHTGGLAFTGRAARAGGEVLKVKGNLEAQYSPFSSGKVPYNSSNTFRDQKDQVSNSALHEFGHMVHMNDQHGDEHREINQVVRNRYRAPDRETITTYGLTDHEEYFAEAFALYHTNPSWLKQNAPKAYYMVTRVKSIRDI